MNLKWKDIKRHLDAMTPEELEDPAVVSDAGQNFAAVVDVKMSNCQIELVKDQMVLFVDKHIAP